MTLVERMREAADMLVKGYNLAGASMILTEAAARIEAMDEHGPDIPETRQYLPTLAELIDRLSIVLLKSIFILPNHDAYVEERKMIEHDIDLLLQPDMDARDWPAMNGVAVRATIMLGVTNLFIWLNEAKAREGGNEQDALLKMTHSINGVRSTAKNVLAKSFGERIDLKVDSFAADFIKDYGHWDVFGDLK